MFSIHQIGEGSFCTANAWTDIGDELKTKLRSSDANALIHWIMCFLDKKKKQNKKNNKKPQTYQMLEKKNT